MRRTVLILNKADILATLACLLISAGALALYPHSTGLAEEIAGVVVEDRFDVFFPVPALAHLEDGVVEMGEGSIESRERYDRTLIDEQHSVVLTYVARMDNVQMVFSSNICQIRNDGVAACWDGLGPTVLKEVQTGIDPFDWHVYTMRMETVPDSYHQTWMDVTLAIDNREVLTSRMARIGLYNLILFWCYWDEAGTTSNTCWLDYMDVRRPDHW